MSTGAYVRIKRADKYQSIEIDKMTDDELDEFALRDVDGGWKWAKFLAKWIRDNIEEREGSDYE